MESKNFVGYFTLHEGGLVGGEHRWEKLIPSDPLRNGRVKTRAPSCKLSASCPEKSPRFFELIHNSPLPHFSLQRTGLSPRLVSRYLDRCFRVTPAPASELHRSLFTVMFKRPSSPFRSRTTSRKIRDPPPPPDPLSLLLKFRCVGDRGGKGGRRGDWIRFGRFTKSFPEFIPGIILIKINCKNFLRTRDIFARTDRMIILG